ncbi:hypothetical protein C7U61_15595 [Rhizobium sp. JAB6]|nr:hypothetical protein C7U61_15595 [Rhizobium sp. JAB6]
MSRKSVQRFCDNDMREIKDPNKEKPPGEGSPAAGCLAGIRLCVRRRRRHAPGRLWPADSWDRD